MTQTMTQTAISGSLSPTTVSGSHACSHGYIPYRTTSDTPAAMAGAGEVYLSALLERYFHAWGIEQKKLRQITADAMKFSDTTGKAIKQVLDYFVRLGTQDGMIAAIDLLSIMGPGITQTARNLAWRNKINADTAFVVAMAAGQVSPDIIETILLRSSNIAMREAAIELLAEKPTEEARPILLRVAAEDSDPGIRRFAAEVVGDLD